MYDKRLIDAEKLTTNIAQIAKNCARSDAQKALIGRILFMIENMPTIEAEPDNGWISVEEKPPMHGACLAIDVNGNMSITRGWMHIEDKKGRQFYIDSDLASHYFDENGRGKKPEIRICIYENRMTHWRYLPEPPKGECK